MASLLSGCDILGHCQTVRENIVQERSFQFVVDHQICGYIGTDVTNHIKKISQGGRTETLLSYTAGLPGEVEYVAHGNHGDLIVNDIQTVVQKRPGLNFDGKIIHDP